MNFKNNKWFLYFQIYIITLMLMTGFGFGINGPKGALHLAIIWTIIFVLGLLFQYLWNIKKRAKIEDEEIEFKEQTIWHKLWLLLQMYVLSLIIMGSLGLSLFSPKGALYFCIIWTIIFVLHFIIPDPEFRNLKKDEG